MIDNIDDIDIPSVQIQAVIPGRPCLSHEDVAEKLRSLLAGLCVSRGVKVGRKYEIAIPDDVYGRLCTGGTLRMERRGSDVVAIYDPAPIEGQVVMPTYILK